MPKLPQVSGSKLVGLLQSLGYEVIRQRGSHIRLRKGTQYLGYRQAGTGITPEEESWRLWSVAPPGGSYGGLKYAR